MTSSCPRLFEVEALRDGRLTGAARASFGRHLSTCHQCATEAAALDDLVERLRAGEDAVEPSDELRAARARTRLLADFDGGLVAAHGAHRRPAARWLLGSAAALAVACALFVWPHRPSLPLAGAPPARVTAEHGALWSKVVTGDDERITLRQGTLAIEVEHPTTRHSRLVVMLPDGQLEDIGTIFTVTVADGRTTRVAVRQGSVLLRLQGSAVAINAGHTWMAADRAAAVGGETAPGDSVAAANAPEPEPTISHTFTPAGGTAKIGRKTPPAARGASPGLDGHPDPIEAARAAEFRAAVHLLEEGDHCRAAGEFGRFTAHYPDDRHAEDAAYLRVIALQRCGSRPDLKEAARDFVDRYPSAFRRAEVERLSR